MNSDFGGMFAAVVMSVAAIPAGAVTPSPSPSPTSTSTPVPDVITKYSFVGECTDCEIQQQFVRLAAITSPGIGTLTLKNYQAGTEFTLENFVNFTYNSSLFPQGSPFVIDNANYLAGSLGNQTGYYSMYFSDGAKYFTSSVTGIWDLGPFKSADTGVDGTWSLASNAVPEPATWALMIVGIGIAGARLRYRRKGNPALATA